MMTVVRQPTPNCNWTYNLRAIFRHEVIDQKELYDLLFYDEVEQMSPPKHP